MSAARFTPTKVAAASQCLHSWYLECFGDPALKPPPDAGTELLLERELEHKRQVVAGIPGVLEPSWDGKDWEAGHKATRELMEKGHPWIYRGVLLADSFAGVPDLLRREEGKSRLGDFTYVPVDVKGHKTVEKKDRYQLQVYALMLDPILGFRPPKGGIWLNTGEIAEVDLSKDSKDFENLLSEMSRIREGALKPEAVRVGACARCPWIGVCSKHWEDTAHVCLLYGVTGNIARKLEQAGFKSWKAIAESSPAEIAARLTALRKGKKPDGAKTDEEAREIWLQARAWDTGKPQVKKPPGFPQGLPVYFYDIETYGGCVYLHGLIRVSGTEREEKQFLARDPSGEAQAWHALLDYLARDERAVIYCWANYEWGFVRELWNKHGGNPKGWKLLSTSLVDQKEFVREHFALPAPSLSIKEVAPLFGFSWSATDANGLNSERWYKSWLSSSDESFLAKILRYNLDDVNAMHAVYRGLNILF